MHYYQHNIGDYARDTGHLSVLEHGIYRLILDWCYLNEKPITTEQAMRVGRGNPTETQSVLSEFFSQTLDGWMHKRVVAEIDSYHAKTKRNRENGSKGGRPKAADNPVGSQSDAKHNPNQEPKNQEPILSSSLRSEEKRTRSAVVAKPVDVGEAVWESFKTLRKAKKAPITDVAMLGIRRESVNAGYTLEQALTTCCERGWTGFKAEWVASHQQTQKTPPESFYEREQRQKRAHWEEMTGRKWPTEQERRTIDITPTTLGLGHEPFDRSN